MLKTTLEQWRMFLAVVEYGGFNQASAAIHKSQSSIHHAVHKIEHSLGVKLFKVEGRKTQLTAAGEMMLRRANYLLEEAERVEAVGKTLAEGVETKLRIAVDEIFPQHVLFNALNNTSAEFPLLHIELVESVLTGASELLENMHVDIAISPFILKDAFSEELCQIEFIAVANPNHSLHRLNRELTQEDLKSHRQIVVRDSAMQRKQDSGWLGANQRWTVSHIRTSVSMICEGLGFAWLPYCCILPEIQAGKLAPLKLRSGSRRKAQLHLMFNDGDQLGPAARTFIGELRYLSMNLDCIEPRN